MPQTIDELLEASRARIDGWTRSRRYKRRRQAR